MLLAPQMMASWWAVLLLGLAASYVFGREYFDRTAKNMLTLPIRREAFVAAKLLVLGMWVAGLALVAVVIQACFALLLGIDGFAWRHVWTAAADCLEIAGLIYLTLPVVGVLAMLEKGYIPPMVFSVFMTTAALMVGVTDAAPYFPWSMPLAAAGSAFGPMIEPPLLNAWSFVISGALFGAGTVALLLYIDRADNLQ
jgi:ABC-2 type transport system permease protein